MVTLPLSVLRLLPAQWIVYDEAPFCGIAVKVTCPLVPWHHVKDGLGIIVTESVEFVMVTVVLLVAVQPL